ncbi:MAG: alpha/beta fold hydrolase [Bacteroidota bacterium]
MKPTQKTFTSRLLQPYLLILGLILGLVACNQPETESAPEPRFEAPLQNHELSDWWLADGDANSDTVVIFCQGGPSDSLQFKPGQRTYWRYLPGYARSYKIFLHQYNTFFPAIFQSEDFTVDDAERITQYSVDILAEAVRYFKGQNKEVWLIGHSYGAFLVTHYLATHPNEANKVAVLSARIDVPQETYESHLKGVNGYFEEGVTFVPDDRDLSTFSEEKRKSYHVKQLLKGSLGSIQHSTLMTDKDLTGVFYFNGDKDDRVGEMTQAEIDFLKGKGAKVFKTRYNHSDTFYGLVEAMEANEIDW